MLVCGGCNRALTVEKTGVDVIQTRGPDQKPYKVWRADRYECKGCGASIVGGFGTRPQTQEGLTGFPSIVEKVVSGAYGDPVIYDHEIAKPQRYAAG